MDFGVPPATLRCACTQGLARFDPGYRPAGPQRFAEKVAGGAADIQYSAGPPAGESLDDAHLPRRRGLTPGHFRLVDLNIHLAVCLGHLGRVPPQFLERESAIGAPQNPTVTDFPAR